MNRGLLYLLANFAYLAIIAVGAASTDGVHVVYLCSLFALCSTPLLVARPLNGPFSVLSLLLLIFFVFYGLQDSIGAWTGRPSSGDTGEMFTATEMAILLGAVLAIGGYLIALAVMKPNLNAAPPKNWSPGVVVTMGLILWAVGSYSAWVWNVQLITDTTIATKMRALSGVSGIKTTLLMMGQMAKPLGMLMIAYAYVMYERAWLRPTLLAVVFFQLLYGFVVDVKGEAMLGIVLVVVTKVLLDGRLPKVWLGVGVLFVVLAFPVFQAHRVTNGSRGIDHAATARDIGKSIERALESRDKVSQGRNRAQNFFERASLKGSVDLIVERTGESVAYREGYTLTPLLAAFIPKLVWADKPDVQAGQVMNQDFHVSISRDTYISPSHLGELYWNFGWTGILLGMPLIGVMLGTVGARANLADRITLTRLLVMVVTIRTIVMGFEGTIAVSYVVWLRSLAGIGILHLLLARVQSASAALQRHSQDEVDGLGQTRTVSVP